MNKVVTSAGLLALSAAALYGYDPEMTRAQTGRPWTVAATVRGFYDDNPVTTPDKLPVGEKNGRTVFLKPEGSFGFEVSPSVHVNLPLEQTFIRAGYVYSMRYYDDREPDNIDQSHEFNALLRHAFSPRHDISVADSFVYTQEPSVVDQFGIVTAPTRTDSDILRNRANVDYNLQLNQVLGLGLGYVNSWYDYEQSGAGSRSALLDRMEHLFRADLRYQVNPSLVALIGYQLGINNYTGDDPIYGAPNDDFLGTKLYNPKSDIRDSYTHYIYAGVDHDFSLKLRGSVRAGVQITDYHELGDTETSPYADASLSYLYLPGSSLQAGVKHQRNATDVATPGKNGVPTLDQETTAGYVQLTHQITPKLTGSVLGQVQFSSFNEGMEDDENETLYLLGINFEYRINYHFAVEAGYNYDLLDSDVETTFNGKRYDARGYDRNRVYIGLRASY
jgi:hypothetical protein